jgi:hypothetical protein
MFKKLSVGLATSAGARTSFSGVKKNNIKFLDHYIFFVPKNFFLEKFPAWIRIRSEFSKSLAPDPVYVIWIQQSK